MTRPRSWMLCAIAVSALSCQSHRDQPQETQDAAVYAAVVSTWRVRANRFEIAPHESFTPADSQLVTSIADSSAAAEDADIRAFAMGVGLHYSRDTAFSPQIPIVRVDSTYDPWPAAFDPAAYHRRTLRLSKVVYLDQGKAALVYLSYSCCAGFSTESLLRLRNVPTRGWVVVRDEMQSIT